MPDRLLRLGAGACGSPPAAARASARDVDGRSRRAARSRKPPPAGGRVGDPDLPVRRQQPRQQRQQQLAVAALVEQVGAEHEVPRAALEQRPGLAPRAGERLQLDAVAARVLASRARSRRAPSRWPARGRRPARRPCSAAPARSPARACAPPRSARAATSPGQRDAARPQLGPVGQVLLVLEGALVEQRVAVARAQHGELAPGERRRSPRRGPGMAARSGRRRLADSRPSPAGSRESRAWTSPVRRASRSPPSRSCCRASRRGGSRRRPRRRSGARPSELGYRPERRGAGAAHRQPRGRSASS